MNLSLFGVVFVVCALSASAQQLDGDDDCHFTELTNDDVQNCRQDWFRTVTQLGTRILFSCVERTICLTACMDGWNVERNPVYQQVPPYNILESKIVENSSGDNGDNNIRVERSQAFKEANADQYGGEICRSECQKNYPECDIDMEVSLFTNFLFRSLTLLHRLGLSSLGSMLQARDFLIGTVATYSQQKLALKKGLEAAYLQMLENENAYIRRLKREKMRRKRRDIFPSLGHRHGKYANIA